MFTLKNLAAGLCRKIGITPAVFQVFLHDLAMPANLVIAEFVCDTLTSTVTCDLCTVGAGMQSSTYSALYTYTSNPGQRTGFAWLRDRLGRG